jgi:hypothetical protein
MWATCPRSALSENGRAVTVERQSMCESAPAIFTQHNERNVISFHDTPRATKLCAGIATGYGLVGQGIEYRRGRDFPHPSIPALGPSQPPVHWAPVIPEGKAAGAWR